MRTPCSKRPRWASAAAALLLLGPALRSQNAEMVVSLADGSVLQGEVLGVVGSGAEAGLQVRVAGGTIGTKTLPMAQILSLHGAVPRPTGAAVVHLVGGDQLRGELGGGDDAGESFTVRSLSLGQVSVPVDRLSVVIFGARAAGATPGDMQVAKDAKFDEALFRPVDRGFDTVLGAIHSFTPRGVIFEWGGEQAEMFRYEELAGIALRGGVAREGAADAQLVTRAGDVLTVRFVGVERGRLLFRMEGDRASSLALGEVAALTFLGAGRRFLSDLEPIRIEEKGTHFPGGATPLHRFKRDRAAAGGFLVVGRVPFGKGLGVHGRCVLTYRVPVGFTRLCALVGIDDSVLKTPVRGSAAVRVKVDGEVVFGPEEVRGGQAARNLGVIAVKPKGLLTLEVDFGEGWFLGDRVDWLTAVLLP